MSVTDKVIAKIVNDLQQSDYGVTAVKVELEAQLGREDGEEQTCYDCDGDGYHYCEYCDEGSVLLVDDDGNDLLDADGDTQYTTCDDCDGSGRNTCNNCDGDGYFQNDGYSDDYCAEFIRGRVSDEARRALIFDLFYNDHSVDSEYTFTVRVDGIKYIPEYIEAFKQLANEIGDEFDTSGAGMHIAILNDPNGAYGTYRSNNVIDDVKFANFQNAMTPLLPALYFLASPDHVSRPLGYRQPEVSRNSKYYAITAHQNVFEYRIFETCYDRPDAIIDMIAVIAKTLQFYKDTPTDTRLNIGRLGLPDRGYDLKRFYFSEKHIDALRHGLKFLKPDHKTLKELMTERKMTVSKTALRKEQSVKRLEFRGDYNEYKDRFKYGIRFRQLRLEAQYYEMCEEHGVRYIQNNYGTVEEYVKKNFNDRKLQSISEYIQFRFNQMNDEHSQNMVSV